jgi:N-acetyl-gamma-glutamyl-phosphate reductase
MKKSISIIGASGYSGAELLSVLLHHPQTEINHLFANSSAGKPVEALYPRFRSTKYGGVFFEEYDPDKVAHDDLVIIALPSGEAMKYVPALIDAGKRVIDLGGDFRLKDILSYRHYYKHDHSAASYVATAVYGLPEWNADAISSAQLIANPGCYATSALLPLLPLVKDGLVESNGITISSLSGVSGAGRSSSVELSFSEVNESVRAYKIGTHQHTPEIEHMLQLFGAVETTVTFVPHLIPITRGIYSTIVARLNSGTSKEDIARAFEKKYSRSPFIRLLGEAIPEIKHVQHTNFIDIGWHVYERNRQVIITSVIDNLLKGAAGQAVQNMNLMFGFNEPEGLL